MSVGATSFGDGLSLSLDKRELALWSGAAAAVVALHLFGAWYFSRLPPIESPPADSAPAIMIDLAPMAVAPEAVETEMAELVDSISADAVEDPVETAEPVENPTPVTEEITEEAEPVETEPVEQVVEETAEPVTETVDQVEEVVPDLVEVEKAEVAMAIPEPEVVEQVKPEPKPKPVVKKPVKKAQPKPAKPAPPEQVASKKSAADAPTVAAPKASRGSSGSGMSPARWQARVNAHLNRHKRYPSGASGSGSVTVRFSITASGAVTSASVVRSSGDSAFDSAALDLVRRASPVPAPPESIARSRMSLTVPIRFSR